MEFLDFNKKCQYYDVIDEYDKCPKYEWCNREKDYCTEKKCQLYVMWLRRKLKCYEKALIEIFEGDTYINAFNITVSVLSRFNVLDKIKLKE